MIMLFKKALKSVIDGLIIPHYAVVSLSSAIPVRAYRILW